MQYNPLGFYTSPLLEKFGVSHGFGTKHQNLPPLPLWEREGVRGAIPKTHQIHSNRVEWLQEVDPDHIYTGDAWLTDSAGVVCHVRTADCLPILIYDPGTKVIGAIHAGWRGIAAHIIRRSLAMLFDKGSRPEDILAALGPRIRQNCYSVGNDLLRVFKGNGWGTENLTTHKDGKIRFSLSRAVCEELEACGVSRDNIDMIQVCTYCDSEMFHSHRRDPSKKGRQVNFISL